MPKLEDLQKFQQRLLSVADEDTVLAEQGLRPELVDPPSEDTEQQDFSDLFDADDTPDTESEEAPVDHAQQLFESIEPEGDDAAPPAADTAAEDDLPEFGQELEDDPFAAADSSGIPDDLLADMDIPDAEAIEADEPVPDESGPAAADAGDQTDQTNAAEGPADEVDEFDDFDLAGFAGDEFDMFADEDDEDDEGTEDTDDAGEPEPPPPQPESTTDAEPIEPEPEQEPEPEPADLDAEELAPEPELDAAPDDFNLDDIPDLEDVADFDADTDAEDISDLDDLSDLDTVSDLDEIADTAAEGALEGEAGIEDVFDLDLEPDVAAKDTSAPVQDDFSTPDFDDLDTGAGLADDQATDELGLDDLGDLGDFGDVGEAEDSGGSDDNLDDLAELGEVEDFGDFGSDEDFDVDEFSLGDFGEQFGVLEEEQGEALGEDVMQAAEADDAEVLEEAESDDMQLSDEEFSLLRRNLQRLPLNVKYHVEDIIADGHGSLRQQRMLIDQILNNETAKAIAGSAGRIIGKRIQVPRGYEKHTGVEFEEDKNTFRYQFTHVIWPVLRTALIILTVTASIVLSGYHFVFSPLYAGYLYSQGHEQLEENEYTEAERLFAHAQEYYHSEHWYIRYGEGYREEREYLQARERFDDTLARWPRSRDGHLAYAEMESEDLVNYPRAEELLQGYYRPEESDSYDYHIELARGDNFLRWGQQEYERYEDARRTYARLIEREGAEDLLLFRMLRYFIRTDNLEEVRRLQAYFDLSETPVDGRAYTELGGYLLDKHLGEPSVHSLDGVNDILLSALDAAPEYPPVYYHIARQARLSNDQSPENRALERAIELFEAKRPLGRLDMEMLIDSIIRRGENYADREQDLDAMRYLTRAQSEYEDAVDRLLIEPQARFGRLYTRIGDIYYYRGSEYDDALDMYAQAKQNGYTPREQDYKMGVINYRSSRYNDALEAFTDARGTFGDERNLDYAIGNTLFRRSSYSAAAGYYSRLLGDLRAERSRISNLYIDENPRHRHLMEYLRRTLNNLGVTMLRESEVRGDRSRWTEGVALLTESAEISENLFRDPQTAERAEIVNLGYLNVRSSLVPGDSFDVEIFDGLLRDFDDQSFASY